MARRLIYIPQSDFEASVSAHLPIDEQWLKKWSEEPLEPDLPIVDAHHHLWDRSRSPRYFLDDLLSDLQCGHRIVGTVFVECRSAYRADADPEWRSVGETEFANGIGALSASDDYGPVRICAGIVASVDLRSNAVEHILQAHLQAGGLRIKGIRQIAARSNSEAVRVAGPVPPPGLLADAAFRRGFALLSPMNLSFDAWVYHSQLGEVADLASAFPDTKIILNHTGGPIGIGPYAGRRGETFSEWRAGMGALAHLPNIYVKLGGLGMRLGGFGFNEKPLPPTSRLLAQVWKPYFETCIELFGSRRCMFESNFPVDKASTSYGVLWNCFKRVAEDLSSEDKTGLFSATAMDAYRLELNTTA